MIIRYDFKVRSKLKHTLRTGHRSLFYLDTYWLIQKAWPFLINGKKCSRLLNDLAFKKWCVNLLQKSFKIKVKIKFLSRMLVLDMHTSLFRQSVKIMDKKFYKFGIMVQSYKTFYYQNLRMLLIS
jgi:hypothetical protein